MSNSFGKKVLDNGLTVITVPMENVLSVTALLLVGAGSRYEDKKINGLSHFLEHMAFKGTKGRPTALEIAEEIDSVGAENNAFTGKEYTGYYIKAAAQHLELGVDILADMLLNSLFAPEEIELEKGVIIEEINMYEDMPAWQVAKNFERLLYPDSPLGREILGEKETVRGIGREDFIGYLGRWYKPENAVFVVAGGTSESEAEEFVAKHFLGWDGGDTGGFATVKDIQSAPKVDLQEKDTEQSHIVLGARAFSREDPRRWALSVMSAVLSGGMSSRLFHEVRERRGLAYYIKGSAQRYTDVGYFAARAGVDKGRIDEAIRVTLSEFNRIKTELVGDKELNKAKEYLKGNLVLGLEDSREVASFYGSGFLLEGKIRLPEEVMEKIEAVGADEVKAAAAEIFQEERLNLAVIGPFGDRQRFEDLLKL